MAGSRMTIPDLVGFGWEEARDIARAAGLVPRAVGPDGQAVNGKGGVVIDQHPAAGERAARGADLSLRVAFGGGPAGDREPREPIPDPNEFEDWLTIPSETDMPGRKREPALAGRP